MNLVNELTNVELETTKESGSNELTFALKEGKIVHISEVEQGLGCECNCPHCGSALIARKGNIRSHHFAHHNALDCDTGMETAIHLLAKEIIKDEKCLYVPSYFLKMEHEDKNGRNFAASSYLPSECLQFSDVKLEQHNEDYVPDITALTETEEWVDIEILVTHKVDEHKALRQRQRGKTMIEIDLSDLPRDSSRQEITKAVLLQAPRYFIHNIQRAVASIHLDTGLAETVNYVDNLIDAVNTRPSFEVQPHEVILVGFKVGNGYTTKGKRDFKISHLFYLKPSQRKNTTNFTIESSGGFEVATFEVDEALIPSLESLTFPAKVTLSFSYNNYSRHNKNKVTSFQLVD